jgi:hypothetical protein
LVAGTTDLRLLVTLPTTITSGTAGLKLAYTRTGAAAVTSTAVSTTPTGLHTDWGIAPVDATNLPTLHVLDFPDAAFAVGATAVTLSVAATGMATQQFTFPLAPPVRVYGAVVAGTNTTTSVNAGWTNYGTNQLARRILEFLTGACAGQRVAVVANTAGGQLELAPPLTIAPSAGDELFLH